MTQVTFSYLQIDTGLELNPPKIWDTHPNSDVMIYGSKLKHNYQEKTIPWSNMHRMVQSGYRAISGAVTKNGHMTEDNFVSMKMVLLDFDEGFKLNEMKERFKDYTYLIHTSRNHMKDKSGKGVAERFRVILPLEHVYTDKSELQLAMKFMVNEIYKAYGIDEKCKDLTRIMFTGGMDCEYQYNEGILFPMTIIIDMAKEWNARKIAEQKARHEANSAKFATSTGSDKTKADWYRENFNTPLMYDKLKYEEKAASGRNNALNQVAYYLLNDVGLTDAEVVNAVMYINSQHSNPIEDREIESTIFRSLRIGGVA